MQPPALSFICEIRVELEPAIERGPSPGGRARIIPIIGGVVTGDRLSGEVLDLGGDWQTIYEDGYAEIDTRYAIRTHDGALIDIRNYGLRHGPAEVMDRLARGEPVDPSAYYMRTFPRLQTGDPRYAWVNRTMFLGTGQRMPDHVLIGLFEVR